MDYLSPAGGGLLDLRLPWATLTGQSLEPGYLARLGPITATQASYLADLAARDPTARWRVIVTDSGDRAVAVAGVPGTGVPGTGVPGTGVPGTPGQRIQAQPKAGQRDAGLVGQVTVIVGRDCLVDPQQMTDPTGGLPPILVRVLAAARAAAARAAGDAQAAGGCAHAAATQAYRPTRQLWEHVTARDLTCRFLTCGQPATRCDLDHTIPFDQGGRTCSCNLGGVCRFHHQIKQHPRWHLTQPNPGAFTWTTATGRTYIVQPDSHAA